MGVGRGDEVSGMGRGGGMEVGKGNGSEEREWGGGGGWIRGRDE